MIGHIRVIPTNRFVYMQKPDPLEGARADRDDLLAKERWLSAEEVARALKAKLTGVEAENWVAKLRQNKQLFGVRFRGRYLHPEFQIEKPGMLQPNLQALISLLPITDANWTAAFWLFQPDRRLDGRRPVDVFGQKPDAVVSAARQDFVDGPYEGEPVLPKLDK